MYQGESINWHAVSSSNVEAVGMSSSGRFAARFKGGRAYIYDGADETVLEAILHENELVLQNPGDDRYSVGRRFNELVKKAGYDYAEIGG